MTDRVTGFFLRHARAGTAVLALAVTLTGFLWTAHVAGGADAYGYVSEADLWLKGRLQIHQDFGADPPWPAARFTLAPLGYRTVADGYDIVPLYSPGLPLLMAAAKAVAGRAGVYAIVPLSGGLLVLLTGAIGRRLGRPLVGVGAAWLVATSPAVLFMLMAPMSDVPAAAFWALAVWCALGDTPRRALASGLAASVAILIRPNLFSIGVLIGLWLVAQDLGAKRWRDWRTLGAPAFAATASLGIIAVALIFNSLYGSPFHSGYGDLSVAFGADNILPNVRRYGSWIAGAETPLALAGLAALALPLSSLWPSARARRARWLLLGVAVILISSYLVYLPFEAWWYLRFLLPLWPMMAIGSAAVVAALTRPLGRWSSAVALAVFAAIGVHGVVFGYRHDVFRLGDGEMKYVEAARLIAAVTDPNDVILTMQHSGSVRYYGGRLTVRWDEMDPGWIDGSVQWMTARGHHVYILLEPWEIDHLREKYGASDAIARLTWPPIASIRGGAVALYDTVTHRAVPPLALPPTPRGWSYPAPAPALHFRW